MPRAALGTIDEEYVTTVAGNDTMEHLPRTIKDLGNRALAGGGGPSASMVLKEVSPTQEPPHPKRPGLGRVGDAP